MHLQWLAIFQLHTAAENAVIATADKNTVRIWEWSASL